MTAKKWHWRARVSSLQLLDKIAEKDFTHLLTSSVLPLAELLGMCPRLISCKKVIYFHENQLVYPIQEVKNRDVQFGSVFGKNDLFGLKFIYIIFNKEVIFRYNQITSCLAADKILFNSYWNLESLCTNIPKFFKLFPDFKPSGVPDRIRKKSKVVYFPVKIPNQLESNLERFEVPHIVWAHRWEHDKNPEAFFEALKSIDSDFRLSVLGETYSGTF